MSPNNYQPASQEYIRSGLIPFCKENDRDQERKRYGGDVKQIVFCMQRLD
jgi:hypothetical protein